MFLACLLLRAGTFFLPAGPPPDESDNEQRGTKPYLVGVWGVLVVDWYGQYSLHPTDIPILEGRSPRHRGWGCSLTCPTHTHTHTHPQKSLEINVNDHTGPKFECIAC